MMLKQMLRVTHLERGEDGWYIRFTGEDMPFNRMRNDLKGLPRYSAKWVPYAKWPDGKVGAWWIDDSVARMYTHRFTNLASMIDTSTRAEADAARDAGDTFNDDWPYTHTTTRKHTSTRTEPRPVVFTPPHVVKALATLGLQEVPARDVLKKRWRYLANEFHPDKTGGKGEAAFKEVNNANSTVLKWLDYKDTIDRTWPSQSA